MTFSETHETETQDAARTLFVELTGREPDGLWSAPGRVNLIGEHTDYNDGFVLPFAIPHRTVAAVGLRDDDRGRVRVASTFAAEPVEVALDELDEIFPTLRPAQGPGSDRRPAVPEWAAYPLGVAWALRQALTTDGAERSFRGMDIAIASDVPVGAGLSSSAAIEGGRGIRPERPLGRRARPHRARSRRPSRRERGGRRPDRDHGPNGVDAR